LVRAMQKPLNKHELMATNEAREIDASLEMAKLIIIKIIVY